MSEDRPGSGTPGDGLTEEQVTRLLAAAGASAPTPPEVTARLDGVLADLVAARGGTPDVTGTGTDSDTDTDSAEGDGRTAPVVALAKPRGRRTWAPRLLVAAAVLGLVGIGFSVADDLGGVSDSASSESASAGDAADSAQDSAQDSAEGSAGGPMSDESAGGPGAGQDEEARQGSEAPDVAMETMRLPSVLRITDAASLRDAVRAGGDTDLAQERDSLGGSLSSRKALESAYAACATPRGPGSRTLVTYEGSPATLVVRRVGDRLDGRVYDCDLGLQVDGVEIGPAGE